MRVILEEYSDMILQTVSALAALGMLALIVSYFGETAAHQAMALAGSFAG